MGIVKTHRALEPIFEEARTATRAVVPMAAFLTFVAAGFLVLFTG